MSTLPPVPGPDPFAAAEDIPVHVHVPAPGRRHAAWLRHTALPEGGFRWEGKMDISIIHPQSHRHIIQTRENTIY